MRKTNFRKQIKFDGKMGKAVIWTAAAAALAGILFFFVYFHVETVEVMGSVYYSEEQIREMVLKGPLAGNSVLAPALYSKTGIREIPFIEAVDVSQVNNHTICISVTETQMVGCVKFLDCYVYFDRDGMIVASSVDRDMRAPFFTGMEIPSVVYGDTIPFADESFLNTAVSLSRIFAKNNNVPDYIMLDGAGNISLNYGEITVQLGPDKFLEDKMTRLLAILPKITGQRGVLHLESVSDNRKTITFEKEGAVTPDANGAEKKDGENIEFDSDSDSGDSETDSGSYDSSDSGSDSGSYDSGSDSGSYDSGSDSDSETDSGSDSGGYDSGSDSGGYDSDSDS